MATSESRRSLMGFAFGTVAAIGGVFSLVAVEKIWDLLPSVKAAGFTTVDLSGIQDGEFRTVGWRKRPIFTLKKDPNMEEDTKRDVVVDNAAYIVVVGLCTHLGCIPAHRASEQLFKCICYGGEFGTSGKSTFGPPPRPLDIPPFKTDGTKLVLGEEGPEYRKITEEA